MNTWWTSLTPTMQILWGITLTATLVFIIQSIMTFMGLGDTVGMMNEKYLALYDVFDRMQGWGD